jgi:hypothetical protein
VQLHVPLHKNNIKQQIRPPFASPILGNTLEFSQIAGKYISSGKTPAKGKPFYVALYKPREQIEILTTSNRK